MKLGDSQLALSALAAIVRTSLTRDDALDQLAAVGVDGPELTVVLSQAGRHLVALHSQERGLLFAVDVELLGLTLDDLTADVALDVPDTLPDEWW